MSAHHERALEALRRRGRLRALETANGIDFASNDYLGLASSKALRDAVSDAIARGVPVGAGGSRLLRGNDTEHEALEAEAAAFFRAERALFFGGGFVANTALYSTLPARGDLVVYDELIHASVHDGLRLSKADSRPFAHNDADACETIIKNWRTDGGTGRVWIGVETLYSMDGDRAPLGALAALAERHDAMLLLDEAHATGVFGEDGRGLGADLEGRQNVVSLHTCGKALGASGALVLCSRTLRDFLVNRARAFIYATAPSPLVAAAVRAALRICANEPERRAALQARIELAGKLLQERLELAPSGSQIQPIIVGTDTRAVALAQQMKALGYDIRAIRPPTVPEGTARLRLAITLNASSDDIAGLIDALVQAQALVAEDAEART
ncbi:MAG: 8-amino-7-oxononanoate synthase [Hyphomicrobiaceae bacterium]|nr:8-amino-7-oxononanoate synthase [Hyphomicrobiaceae bacterium]